MKAISTISVAVTALLMLAVMSTPVSCQTKGRGGTIADSQKVTPAFDPSKYQLPPQTKDLAESCNAFAFRLFDKLREVDTAEDIFFSPASVSLVMSMVANGADGLTLKELAATLLPTHLSLSQVNAVVDSVLHLLTDPEEQVQLTVANSLWLNDNFSFRQSFVDEVTRTYHAEVSSLPFGDASSASIINSWVNDATRGRIPSIVDQLGPLDAAVVVNAIYFKGSWRYEFDLNCTVPKDFHLLDGTTRKHDLMHQQRKWDYLETDSLQMIALPYDSGRLRMIVLLPAAGLDYDQFLQSLNSEIWLQWSSALQPRKGTIGLPRFKLEWKANLNDELQKAGIVQAFDAYGADLSRMCALPDGQNAYISDVIQKTFVEVNEEGTEAAAATSATISVTSIAPESERPFTMIVDRPFFVTIEDCLTGLVLFMGAITDPVPSTYP